MKENEAEQLLTGKLPDNVRRFVEETKENVYISYEQEATLGDIDRTKPKNLIEASYRRDMLGVIVGIKPAALLEGTPEVLTMAHDLELLCTKTGVDNAVAVSRYGSLANHLATRVSLGRDDSSRITSSAHHAIGTLLGYPETAVNYFVNNFVTLFTSDELSAVKPLSKVDYIGGYFSDFVLSAGRYEEEIKTYASPLEDATKEYLPKTYEYFERMAHRQRFSNEAAARLRHLAPTHQSQTPPFAKRTDHLDD